MSLDAAGQGASGPGTFQSFLGKKNPRTGEPITQANLDESRKRFDAFQKSRPKRRPKPSLGKSLLGGALGGVESLLGR